MGEEIPAIAVIEGYRSLVAELTEENLMLKWQVRDRDSQIAQMAEVIQKMGHTPEE
jgi:hypothetical protein